MTFNLSSWLGLLANLITLAVTLAFLILTLGLGRRHLSNRSFALFLLLVCGWIGCGQFTQILLWLGQGNPTLSLEMSAAFYFLQGAALFHFAGRLIGLRRPWFFISVGAAFAVWLAGMVPLLNHRVLANPRLSPTGLLRWDTYPLGYVFIAVSFSYLMGAFLLSWTHHRRVPHPSLTISMGIIALGEVLGLIGALFTLPFPILTLNTTLGVGALGSSMVYFQLFKPLSDMTRELRARQAELEAQNRCLEETNLKLREANEWTEKMTQMIVHDLKSPLGVIKVVLDEFQSRLSDHMDDTQRQLLESALAATHRIQGRVHGLLDLRRLENGQLPIKPIPLAPASFIEQCVESIGPLSSLYDITLQIDMPAQVPWVYADPIVTSRVLENLLDNAIKFSPSPGTVTLRARRDADVVQFSVIDSGPGIPPAYQQQIFEKFFQLTLPTQEARTGTGLGLAFCKLAVEAQGGRIWVESDGSHGTAFHFTLPISREPVSEQ